MNSVLVRLIRDASDVDLQVSGGQEGGTSCRVILSPQDLRDTFTHLKLSSAFYCIESGLKVILFWEHAGGEHVLLAPLEGRGLFSLDKFNGIEDPRVEGWTGNVLMQLEGKGRFSLCLEFMKQRRG